MCHWLGVIEGRSTRWRGWRAPGTMLIGLLCLVAAVQAQDDPPGRVGRIASLQGEVWVYEAEQGEWVVAQRNRPLTQGDRLSTSNAGRVELRIGSTALYLGGSAELEAVRLDDERMQFALLRGSLGLRVRSIEVAAELEVLSPEGRFMPSRSGLYRVDRQDESSFAGVWRGELQFQSPDLVRTVHPGQRAEFWRDGPQRVTRSQWLAPLDDEFAQALLRDDQADTRSAATMFVSPEMTGVEELDRFGAWQQHPEFGAVWTPADVASTWVPYRYGQWVWLRPWGWTWVDDAPWGFAPFHYGRWLWWGNRWCWAPGGRMVRPVYAPALVAWVGGPQYSMTVGTRPVPAVGWVALAPREVYRPGYRAGPDYLMRLNPHADQPGLPAPGQGNRGVPGAVTVLPMARLTPRQPVAAAALRADEMARQRQWQSERFHHEAPGRPAFAAHEAATARASGPSGAATAAAQAPLRSPVDRAARLPSPMPASPAFVPAQAAPVVLPTPAIHAPQPVPPPRPAQPAPPIQAAPPSQAADALQAAQPGQPMPAAPPGQRTMPGRQVPPATVPGAQSPSPGTPFSGHATRAAPQQPPPQAPAVHERANVPPAPSPQPMARSQPTQAPPSAVPMPNSPAAVPAGRGQSPAVAAPVAAPAAAVPKFHGAPPAAAPPAAPARAEPANVAGPKGDSDPDMRRRAPESRATDSRTPQRER